MKVGEVSHMTKVQAKSHPTGKYRAYKKINGKEYQFYSKNKVEADREQERLERMASLAPRRVFALCGRLIGFRVMVRRRQNRSPCIYMQKRIGRQTSPSERGQFTYDQSFEEMWLWAKKEWKAYYALTARDMAEYSHQLKAAKRLYMSDVGKAEETLKEHECNKKDQRRVKT